MLTNVISIDIGMINLGIVCACIDDGNIQVEKIAKVNLVHCMHKRVSAPDCTLYHSNATCDRVAHFIQEWKPWFDKASVVIVERQPPGGLKDVEALLQHCMRDKVQMAQPQSMHAFFGLPRGDYDGRKELTVGLAAKYMQGVQGWNELERQHDVADAMCQLVWWNSLQPRKREASDKNEFWTYAFNNNNG